MHLRLDSTWILATLLLGAAACRSSDNTGADAPHSTIDAPAGSIDAPGSGGGSDACTSYMTTSIAAMRMGTKTGCYEFDNVITIGTTPSSKSPQLYVQDAAGGDFSGMQTKCSSTSTTHPCSIASTVAALVNGHSVTVKGTYIKTASTTFEEFFIDSVTDNGAGTAPAPATATLAEISRGSTSVNLRFEKVTATIATADTLDMYDWTPAEFAETDATACPFQFGFGMIPKSTTGITAGTECAGSAAQPAGVATPNGAEILIGTDFFDGFTVSSDCRCAKTFGDTEPVTASTLAGSISGILVFDVPFGGTTGYTYIAPEAAADAAITGTVAGM